MLKNNVPATITPILPASWPAPGLNVADAPPIALADVAAILEAVVEPV